MTKIRNPVESDGGQIEQDRCNNQSKTNYCTIVASFGLFVTESLKEIQCPTVHPFHIRSFFLKLNG